MKGLLETKDSLLIPSVSTLVTRPYTFTLKTLLKPWPSSMTTCFVFMKIVHFHIYLSLFLPHYCCQTSKPVGCIERWLLCLLSSPERYPWKPPCTTLKTFWDLQGMFFFSFWSGMDCSVSGKLHPANLYCLHYVQHKFGTGYGSLMCQCSISRKKINWENYTISNQQNQNNRDLKQCFQSLGWKVTWMQILEQVIGNICVCMLKWKDKQYLYFHHLPCMYARFYKKFITDKWENMVIILFSLKKKKKSTRNQRQPR